MAAEHDGAGWRSVATSALRRAARSLDALILALCAALTIAVVGLVVSAVLMRYVVGRPITYSFDLSTLLFAWLVFLGLYLAERRRAHLAVDILDRALPEPAMRWMFLVRQIALAALSLYFAWVGWQLFQRASMTIPSMRISIRWLYGSLPLGFALLALAQLMAAAGWRDPPRSAGL